LTYLFVIEQIGNKLYYMRLEIW